MIRLEATDMQITLTTDYAIRSILYLAAVDRMATAAEVSEKMMIPKQYLTTTARKLKDAGLISAKNGQEGGYYLLRPPEEITLLDVIRVTEATMNLNRCLEHDEYCNRFATACCTEINPHDSKREWRTERRNPCGIIQWKNTETKKQAQSKA